jgi:hypothetical protein
VVAEHDVQPAAGRLGFALQSHQQVHDFARIGAAIEQVAEAHDVRPSRCPAVLRIDDAGFAQQRDQFGVGAVHVSERDHPLDAAPLNLRRLRDCRRRPDEASVPASRARRDAISADDFWSCLRSSVRGGHDGDLARIDALEQAGEQPVHGQYFTPRQAHLQVLALAPHAATRRQVGTECDRDEQVAFESPLREHAQALLELRQ